MSDSGRTIGEGRYAGPPVTITEQVHSGNKYHRKIFQLSCYGIQSVIVDVYSVITAYGVTNPGLQHCVKKILCAGIRGKATEVQDLREARDALDRAIEDAERDAMIKEKPEVSKPPVIKPDYYSGEER